MDSEEMIEYDAAHYRNGTGIWGFCSCIRDLIEYIMHHFQGSSIKTQPGLTGDGFWNQMSGCLQLWRWWIGLLKASTTCFSIIPATAPASCLHRFEWWVNLAQAAADNTYFLWALNHEVFFHSSYEVEREPLYSVHMPLTVKTQKCKVNTFHFTFQGAATQYGSAPIGSDWLHV